MFTATANLTLPSTVTGSWPRPRWFDVSMWGTPLDTCMMDVRFREKFQDALAVVVSDQERAGLDLAHARRLPLRRGHGRPRLAPLPAAALGRLRGRLPAAGGDARALAALPAGDAAQRDLHRLALAARGGQDRAPAARLRRRSGASPRARRTKPVRFGTCCSQVMALFLDIHTPKYRDKREVIWDMAEAMNKELRALRDAGCRLMQIEEPTLHFMANTFGKDHEQVKFMVDAFNREVEGLDDVEIWIHTCWGNPNMQRVMEDTSYAASLELYLERCKGDVWTLEMKDRDQRDLELFEPLKHDLKKKICIGAVSHRTLQADRPEDVAGEIRKALRFIPPERLIVSSDCGFGRQGCNREIAFYKATAIAQGCNLVRRELGLPDDRRARRRSAAAGRHRGRIRA